MTEVNTGLRVKYPLFLSDFNQSLISSTDFREKKSHIKFHENPSSGNQVVPCGRTGIKKLILAFHNFAKAPKYCLGLACLTVLLVI